jgi:large subunit ribosomal protein L3
VRDAVKKVLPKEAPKPGKFREAGTEAAAAQAPAEAPVAAAETQEGA